MHKNKYFIKVFGIIFFILLTSCSTTKMDVKRLNANQNKIDLICIQENQKVIVKEFLPLLQDGFSRHHIKTKIYKNKLPSSCTHSLFYSAHGRWDLYLYLSTAWIEIRQNNEIIAYAKYRGPSGLNPEKRKSTKSKIDPLIDNLLKNY